MEFNAKKCRVLRVAGIRSIDGRDYYLGGIKLDPVDVEKDLGVLVSHNLSWNNHDDLISSKAQKMLNVLYRTCRDINDISTKKLLYIALVRSRLEYASVVWSPYTKRLWNEFPLSIRKSNTLSIFRKNLMPSYYNKFNVNFP